jgi:cytidine deaminase
MPDSSAELSPEVFADLFERAQAAAEHAYAPYSQFRVGAALLFDDGTIVTGCNVENASYGLTSCAERNALFCAVSDQGPRRRIVAIAVANLNHVPSAPCGACRQVLSEFVTAQAHIVFPGEHGEPCRPLPFADLLPYGFVFPGRLPVKERPA